MQKCILLISSLMLSALTAVAITVKPTAGGQLSTLVTNYGETTLNVTGVMDARDFAFIGEKLTKLTVINLEQATIAAYESDKPVLGPNRTFAANTIPAMALASHPTLERFTVPTSVTTIGLGALAGCPKLINVAFPDGLTNIDSYAFAGCPAYLIASLPQSLERLGDGAFMRCTALKTVKIKTTGTPAPLAIGDEAFMACSALTSITFSNKLTSIGHRALAGTMIKSLDLSGYTSLASVGDFAFATT
ncbi:MAG: leucine-rich repeat domain-containing protein, partial [Muribaculaceae bacterium]|nr:leucine-rich repeat domain-containing protein [Muribaculaceae bacterium]